MLRPLGSLPERGRKNALSDPDQAIGASVKVSKGKDGEVRDKDTIWKRGNLDWRSYRVSGVLFLREDY